MQVHPRHSNEFASIYMLYSQGKNAGNVFYTFWPPEGNQMDSLSKAKTSGFDADDEVAKVLKGEAAEEAKQARMKIMYKTRAVPSLQLR